MIKIYKFYVDGGFVIIKAYTPTDAIEIFKDQQPQIISSVYEEIVDISLTDLLIGRNIS